MSDAFFTQVLDYAQTKDGVALSFDDGNESDVEIALPELRQRGLRAAFFPIASRIGKEGSVDRGGLHRLLDAGMTVGSHGLLHRTWRGLRGEALDDELVLARELIAQEAGAPISAAACPLGSYDRHVLHRLRAQGYTQVFTSDRALAIRGAWLQPRYSLRANDTLDDVRRIVEQRPTPRERLIARARITAKRWR